MDAEAVVALVEVVVVKKRGDVPRFLEYGKKPYTELVLQRAIISKISDCYFIRYKNMSI